MSSIVEPQTARPLPSVTAQVVRGALAALAIVVVFALATSLVTGRQPWTSDRWAQLFGDPRIALADGVIPSEAPATSSVVTVDPSVLALGVSIRALERAFGSPVTEVAIPAAESMPAQLQAKDHLYRTPTGTVRFFVQDPGSVGVPLIVVRDLDRSVVAATPEARAALVRRISAGVGFTAGDHVPDGIAVTTTERVSDGHIEVLSSLALGTDGTTAAIGLLGQDRYVFDLDGTFLQALVSGAPAVSVQSVPVGSAAAAYDDLRHHRADVTGGDGAWGPITVEGFELVGGTRIAGTDAVVPAAWAARISGQAFPIYPVQQS